MEIKERERNKARIFKGFISPVVRLLHKEEKSTCPVAKTTMAPSRVTAQKVWKESFPILMVGLRVIARIIRMTVKRKVSPESSIRTG